jgi:hypothetical protein
MRARASWLIRRFRRGRAADASSRLAFAHRKRCAAAIRARAARLIFRRPPPAGDSAEPDAPSSIWRSSAMRAFTVCFWDSRPRIAASKIERSTFTGICLYLLSIEEIESVLILHPGSTGKAELVLVAFGEAAIYAVCSRPVARKSAGTRSHGADRGLARFYGAPEVTIQSHAERLYTSSEIRSAE